MSLALDRLLEAMSQNATLDVVGGGGDGIPVADHCVRLNGAECGPLDYLTKAGSKEILSPLAHAITQLWLQVNLVSTAIGSIAIGSIAITQLWLQLNPHHSTFTLTPTLTQPQPQPQP